MTVRVRWSLVVGVALVAACGKSDSAPTPGGGGGSAAATITITSNGVSPTTVTVPRGSQVLMVNSDSRAHEQASDPHPTHEECPELNTWGNLNPGQSRVTANLNTARTCRFHDHLNPGSNALRGAIVIQ